MFTVIIFILVLGLLVFVHEFGHFVAARKSGMKVHEFGFGFPPRAFGVYKDPKSGKFVFVKGRSKQSGLKETIVGEEVGDEYPATLYSFNWLPLGGFVKIKGENGEVANEPDSFGFHKAWKRIVVLIAGVTMNIVLAAVLFAVGFMVGLPTDISEGIDDKAILVDGPQVLVQTVEKDSPADQAGIQFGDVIISINDVAMERGEQVSNFILESKATELSVGIKRGEEELLLAMTPTIIDETNDVKIGVALVDAAIIKYPWYISLYKGVWAALISVVNIALAFYFVIKSLILGQGLVVDVAGPVGIAVIVGQSARLGINYLLNVTAMISVTLAVINILPIPALDGGRILFILVEKIIRRPVPMKYEQLAHTIGFIVLMGLIILVTGRDIVGLF